MIDWAKLRREWKTAALAVAGLLIEIYEVVRYQLDLPSLFPPHIRPFVNPAILVGMLLLRKWRDSERVQ